MRYSGIGGQAVMEGVMMKNADQYAVAVRTPDQKIVVDVQEDVSICKNKKWKKVPLVRGVINFIDSMVLGMRALTYSASFWEEQEETKKEHDEKTEKWMTLLTVAVSVIFAIGIFMLLPYFLSTRLERHLSQEWAVALAEGALRLILFLAYVTGISFMKDIRRVYMYHGAEHKCINCIEQGMELNVENVKKSSRLHKRCGTSFLLIVLLISILFFMLIRVESPLLRVVFRVLLVPVIAGVAYEFIRLAGRSDHKIVQILSQPGLWLQRITTREPDEAMIEVGIASVEAVFDWRAYLERIEEETL